MKDGKKTCEALKIIFIVVGALVSLAALCAVVYTVFKKYFQVTFDCDDCDCCEDDCVCFEDETVEPICCCDEDDCCDECDCECDCDEE